MASNQKSGDPTTRMYCDDDISELARANPGEIDMLEKMNTLEQLSHSEYYPEAYCNCAERMEKACYEENILELWMDQASIITSFSRHNLV